MRRAMSGAMLRRAGMVATRFGTRSQSAMTMEVNKQGVAIMRLDCPGEAQNTLSMGIIEEFNTVCTAAAPPHLAANH